MTPLKCPHCGYDGTTPPKERDSPGGFCVVEDVPQYREIGLVDREDGLIVAVADGGKIDWESPSNLRLECGNCLEHFPVPEGWSVEWWSQSELAGEVAHEQKTADCQEG